MYDGGVVLLQQEDQVHFINVTIVDDGILEASEIFVAKLSLLSNHIGINLVNSSLPVNIIDNDCKLHN